MAYQAAGPGEQVVRSDKDKARSWVDVERTTGRIGQIFFETDKAELDVDDIQCLETIVTKYYQPMVADPNTMWDFRYLGYADYRPSPQTNETLSQRRADVVSTYLGFGRLAARPNYRSVSQGVGVDFDVDDDFANGRPKDSESLRPYRRVDIYAPGIIPPPPPPPSYKEKPRVSKHWKARIKKNGGIGLGPIQGDRFFLDIVDLDHNLIMEYVYKGLGIGKSAAPIGFSYSGDPTDWDPFIVYPPVTIMDFEGPATHISGQAQAPPSGTGGTFDWVMIFGPHMRCGSNGVFLTYSGFTLIDKNAGFSGNFTFLGTLEPSGDNGGKPRPWAGDPPKP